MRRRLPCYRINEDVCITSDCTRLWQTFFEYAYFIGNAAVPDLGNPQPDLNDSRKTERRKEIAVGRNYDPDLLGGLRVETAILDQVGIDDRIEEMKVDTVVQMPISFGINVSESRTFTCDLLVIVNPTRTVVKMIIEIFTAQVFLVRCSP